MTTAFASPLTALDRCDRCSAQAYVRARLSTGGELLFCAHHARAHEGALRPKVAEWHDHTEALNARASTPER